MKKTAKLLVSASALFVMGLGLVACGTDNTPTSSELTPEAKAAMDVLNAIKVEDFHVTYDGKEHHIREAKFDYPKAGNVVYSTYDKFIEPGTYPYHVTFGYEGFYREVDVNLIIDKYKPTYTGPKEVRVFLDESDTFDITFDIEGVELKNPVHLTQTGDYKVTIETKETNRFAPIDPVEVQVYVREKHYVYGFDSVTVPENGTEYKILLEEKDFPIDTSLFDIVYTNNEGHSERGKYYITATLTEKSNNVVYDTYRAILNIDSGSSSAAFDEYTTEMFKFMFDGDQIGINILIGDYEQYGLEHAEAKWYTFERYSDEDYLHDVNEIKAMREEFDAFDVKDLSNAQLVDYKLIDEMITEYEALLSDKAFVDMRLTYVNQYGGYCADLPEELEGMHINTKEDLDDIVDILESVYTSFMSYYDYIEYREEQGYPLNEYTLSKFIEYLQGVVDVFDDSEEDYYLINIINQSYMLNEDLGLTLDERKAYVDHITELFNEDYYNAHKDLLKLTQDYLDDAKAEGGYLADPNFDDRYFGQYEKGADLYKIMLQNKLGRYDLEPEEYIKQIDKWLKTYLNQWDKYGKNLSAKGNQIADGSVKIVEDTSFDSMLAYLKEFAKTIVPDLESDPDIDVIWMDPTVTANTTTAAYYMKSPLSSNDKEYIHMNGEMLGKDYLNTISTLSHEGYPGHLYAFVNAKENENLSPFATLNTNTTHGEGWATYVQIELNNYIAESKKNTDEYEDWKNAMDYCNAYDLMSYLLYTKCDYVVNYEGADVAGLKKAISKVGLSFRDDSTYEELFHTFNENVAVYPAYGYGKAYFYQLHLDAQEALGEHYDVKDFNRMLLAHGWCSIDSLEAYYNDYLDDQLFLSGLADSAEA